MAYNNQSSGNRFGNRQGSGGGSPSPRPATAKKEPANVLLRTGLFKPKSEKSKAEAGVVTEIGMDIKAGQRVYVDLYKNSEEDIKAGKPSYTVILKEAASAG